MRILVLDVSSTAAGWALMHSEPRVALDGFGVVRPGGRHSLKRIDQIVARVRQLAEEHGPDKVVMEWSEGKVAGRLKARSRGAGLAVLGQAQGAVREALIGLELVPVTVPENRWTGGRKKEDRAKVVAMEWPAYAAWMRRDRGLDAADAIGLGCWWLAKHRVEQLMKGA